MGEMAVPELRAIQDHEVQAEAKPSRATTSSAYAASSTCGSARASRSKRESVTTTLLREPVRVFAAGQQ